MPEQTKTPKTRTRSAEGQITLDATPERVWNALTDAQELVRWFPLDARVTPGPDGSLWMSWLNEYVADMKIEVWEPARHLRTSWSFHEGDLPAQVTDYLIETKGGKTVLRAVTSGFPMDASWDGWVDGTNRGWAFELRSLKHYLERHQGQPRHVVYVRRKVPLTNQEAWARMAGDPELGPWLTGGQAFDQRMALQYCAVVTDPADGLFRVSIEPPGPGADQREIVLWLSGWGDHAQRVAQLRAGWASRLERLFPEGTTP